MEQTLEALFEALGMHQNHDGVIGNLCHIVGIMMMRQGVEELQFSDAELQALGMKYDGRGIEIEPKDGMLYVRLGGKGSDVKEGTDFIN